VLRSGLECSRRPGKGASLASAAARATAASATEIRTSPSWLCGFPSDVGWTGSSVVGACFGILSNRIQFGMPRPAKVLRSRVPARASFPARPGHSGVGNYRSKLAKEVTCTSLPPQLYPVVFTLLWRNMAGTVSGKLTSADAITSRNPFLGLPDGWRIP